MIRESVRLVLARHAVGTYGFLTNAPLYYKAVVFISPSTYQSGQLTNSYARMEKRGSRYLRFALYNAAKYVCHWDPTFAAYLAKKRAEGKHYNVAVSHAAKKLVRLIFALEKSREPCRFAA